MALGQSPEAIKLHGLVRTLGNDLPAFNSAFSPNIKKNLLLDSFPLLRPTGWKPLDERLAKLEGEVNVLARLKFLPGVKNETVYWGISVQNRDVPIYGVEFAELRSPEHSPREAILAVPTFISLYRGDEENRKPDGFKGFRDDVPQSIVDVYQQIIDTLVEHTMER